jgi:hypothetical protein
MNHPNELREALHAFNRSSKGYPPETPEVKWVRLYMWRTNTTQKQMAASIGMDQSYFSKIMTGKRRMSDREFARLLEIIPDPFPVEELQHG